jgi:hypothetical protein
MASILDCVRGLLSRKERFVSFLDTRFLGFHKKKEGKKKKKKKKRLRLVAGRPAVCGYSTLLRLHK